MFSTGDTLGLYRPYRGLAAARIEVRALRVVDIPALFIEMVCCSITSWIAVLSDSSILSNSSIQQMPLSASTSAPPSVNHMSTKQITRVLLVGPKTISSVTGSRITAAVRPTPDEPLPVVYTPLGAIFEIYFNN